MGLKIHFVKRFPALTVKRPALVSSIAYWQSLISGVSSIAQPISSSYLEFQINVCLIKYSSIETKYNLNLLSNNKGEKQDQSFKHGILKSYKLSQNIKFIKTPKSKFLKSKKKKNLV